MSGSLSWWSTHDRASCESIVEPKQIGEIAFAWGFNDLSHFGRTFRERYGLSPRDWRRSQSPD